MVCSTRRLLVCLSFGNPKGGADDIATRLPAFANKSPALVPFLRDASMIRDWKDISPANVVRRPPNPWSRPDPLHRDAAHAMSPSAAWHHLASSRVPPPTSLGPVLMQGTPTQLRSRAVRSAMFPPAPPSASSHRPKHIIAASSQHQALNLPWFSTLPAFSATSRSQPLVGIGFRPNTSNSPPKSPNSIRFRISSSFAMTNKLRRSR